ncbi:ATP-binding protein [Yinghuangia seranimata]|uniref:ATP-binding protein n=1 Tax=Yinghuangia seranimata TaxID=408067 RepID=UPI00248ACEE0|nr:ATP-binding protein [Yinghuangia seranimata]MDI2129084.1 ATP-binding protein [Yinghuangia seranimata]
MSYAPQGTTHPAAPGDPLGTTTMPATDLHADMQICPALPTLPPPPAQPDPPRVGPAYRLPIPPNDAAVPHARHAVLDLAASWGLPPDHERADTVRLIVSELVTNAVKHAGVLSPQIDVFLHLTASGALGIGVHDRHPFRPKALLETVDDDSGRGLHIVKYLVDECGGTAGIEPDHDLGGKTVWVTIPLP